MTITCAFERCAVRFTWTQAGSGGRPPRYCSDDCRQKAFYWRVKARTGKTYDALKGYRRKRRNAA